MLRGLWVVTQGPGWFQDAVKVEIELEGQTCVPREGTWVKEEGEVFVDPWHSSTDPVRVYDPEEDSVCGVVKIELPAEWRWIGEVKLELREHITYLDPYVASDLAVVECVLRPPDATVGADTAAGLYLRRDASTSDGTADRAAGSRWCEMPFCIPLAQLNHPYGWLTDYNGSSFGVRHCLRVTVARPWYTFPVVKSLPIVLCKAVRPQALPAHWQAPERDTVHDGAFFRLALPLPAQMDNDINGTTDVHAGAARTAVHVDVQLEPGQVRPSIDLAALLQGRLVLSRLAKSVVSVQLLLIRAEFINSNGENAFGEWAPRVRVHENVVLAIPLVGADEEEVDTSLCTAQGAAASAGTERRSVRRRTNIQQSAALAQEGTTITITTTNNNKKGDYVPAPSSQAEAAAAPEEVDSEPAEQAGGALAETVGHMLATSWIISPTGVAVTTASVAASTPVAPSKRATSSLAGSATPDLLALTPKAPRAAHAVSMPLSASEAMGSPANVIVNTMMSPVQPSTAPSSSEPPPSSVGTSSETETASPEVADEEAKTFGKFSSAGAVAAAAIRLPRKLQHPSQAQTEARAAAASASDLRRAAAARPPYWKRVVAGPIPAAATRSGDGVTVAFHAPLAAFPLQPTCVCDVREDVEPINPQPKQHVRCKWTKQAPSAQNPESGNRRAAVAGENADASGQVPGTNTRASASAEHLSDYVLWNGRMHDDDCVAARYFLRLVVRYADASEHWNTTEVFVYRSSSQPHDDLIA